MYDHAPSPWSKELCQAPGATYWKIRDGTGRLVANLRSEIRGTTEETKQAPATAALIATAPELLAACEAALGLIAGEAAGLSEHNEWKQAERLLEKVLARATQTTPE